MTGYMGVKTKLKKTLPSGLYQPLLPSYHWLRAVLANIRYGFPARKLEVIGVTGTNGKTTTVNMIGAILEAAGHKVGILSTAVVQVGNSRRDSELALTTEDASVLQKYLREMVNDGVTHLVLEVSSIGLVQSRVWGISFRGAVFTNLSQDHLDYHHTMDRYAAAKRKLFERAKEFVVINGDDTWFEFFSIRDAEMTTVYGTTDKADVRVRRAKITNHGSVSSLSTPEGEIEMKLNLTGKFNVYNAMAAVAVAQRMKIPSAKIQQGLASLQIVPGRMESIDEGQSFDVILDYAHTPDALTNVLENLRQTTKGQIIVVFGATGDRDKSKRPLMGKIVARLSDIAIVTDDDTYTEDPATIRAEVLKGANAVVNGAPVYEVVNRRQAINKALKLAKKSGDTVLLAGIGNQNYRIDNGKKIDWSEGDAVREELAKIAKSAKKRVESKKVAKKVSKKINKASSKKK